MRKRQPQIHVVGGHPCVRASDLARAYGVSEAALRRTVERHREHLPADFVVELKEDGPRRGCAFTAAGAIMLAFLLPGKRARTASVAFARSYAHERELAELGRIVGGRLRAALRREASPVADLLERLVR